MVIEEGGDSHICSLPTTGFSQLTKEQSQIVLGVCSEQLGKPAAATLKQFTCKIITGKKQLDICGTVCFNLRTNIYVNLHRRVSVFSGYKTTLSL